MNSPLTFGEWLRRSREELGLTRKEFGRRVGCSVSTLRKIEDSERHPSVQIAELIANCLDIPPAEHSTFVKVARGELGVDRLSPVLKLVGDPNISPASATPPLRANLPVLPTPLIGRQREMDELIRLLRDPQCRLLTLGGDNRSQPAWQPEASRSAESAEHQKRHSGQGGEEQTANCAAIAAQ